MPDLLACLKKRLSGKAVIVGIGNTLRCDDGAGSILARRLKSRVAYTVYDTGSSPENYLGKIAKDNPDTILLVDAVDFAGKPGELKVLEGKDLKTANLFSSHNASLTLLINYLRGNTRADIIMLIIQPQLISLGETLSPQVQASLDRLEQWFCEGSEEKG
jgi:hydrogenase 3 maturation protease